MTTGEWDREKLEQFWEESGGKELENNFIRTTQVDPEWIHKSTEVEHWVLKAVDAMNLATRKAFIHALVRETLCHGADSVPLHHNGIYSPLMEELLAELKRPDVDPVWLSAAFSLAGFHEVDEALFQCPDQIFEQINSLDFYRQLHEAWPESTSFAADYRHRLRMHPDARLHKQTLLDIHEIYALIQELYPPNYDDLSRQDRKQVLAKVHDYFSSLGEAGQHELITKILNLILEGEDFGIFYFAGLDPLDLKHKLFRGKVIQILKEKCSSELSGLWMQRSINHTLWAWGLFSGIYSVLPDCVKELLRQCPYRRSLELGSGDTPCVLDPESPRIQYYRLQQHLEKVLSVFNIENWDTLTPKSFNCSKEELFQELADMNEHLEQAEDLVIKLPEILVPKVQLERARNWLHYWDGYLHSDSEQDIGEWISEQCGIEHNSPGFGWNEKVGLPLGTY